MSVKFLLTLVVLLLLVVTGALITGQFDVHPALAIVIALIFLIVAALILRKRGD